MPELQVLALVTLVALLVPIALLWCVRFAVWLLPSAHKAWAALTSRHRLEVAVFEAAAWLLLLVLSFTWTSHWSDWIPRTFYGLLVFEAIRRVLRIRRTSHGTTSGAAA